LTEKQKILKSASIITLATLTSRILGYLRDQRITLLLGTSLAADSFILAFQVPNLLRRLVGDGSMTASFIPVFSGYVKKPNAELWRFASRVFWALTILLACLTMLGVAFSPQLIRMLTLFGKNPGQWDLAVYLNRIIFPFLFFIGLSALAMAILNSFHIFGLPASTPILFNLSIIVLSLGLVYRPVIRLVPEAYRTPAVALALGVVIGGALQFLVQVPELVRQGMRFLPTLSFADPGVRKVGRLLAPGFFGVGIYQFNFIVDRVFATSAKMPQGSVMSLYIAGRVTELVLGVYAISVATAILPVMSHQAAAKDYEALKKTFTFALRIVSFIALPGAVGLIVLREPIIQILFQHGKFSAESTQLTAQALLFYGAGLPPFAGLKLIVPAFYSTQDTRTPVRIAAFALGLNIALNLVFLEFLFSKLYNGGPPLASSLSAYFSFFLLFWLFRERLGRLGARALFGSFGKVLASSAVMGMACYGMLRFAARAGINVFLGRAAMLAVMIAAGLLVYLGAARLLRCKEIDELREILRGAELPPAETVAMG
jgi:putative peptidoglycan lipid II flippase